MNQESPLIRGRGVVNNSINSIGQHFVFSPVRAQNHKILGICGVLSSDRTVFFAKN